MADYKQDQFYLAAVFLVVAVSPFVSLYTSTFSYFCLSPENHYRLVETKDKTGKEFLPYVELSFSGKNGLSIKEFDVYEF